MNKDKHLAYLSQCANLLPHYYTSQDLNQIMLANFVTTAYDVLGSVTQMKGDRAAQVKWIYAHLVPSGRGFRGSLNARLPPPTAPPAASASASSSASSSAPSAASSSSVPFSGASTNLSDGAHYDPPNLPATYFAIMTLLVLGDSLAGLDPRRIMREVVELQRDNGSFSVSLLDRQEDVRFTYMAAAIRYVFTSILKSPGRSDSGGADCPDGIDINMDKALDFLAASQSYDGGYGQGPKTESHAGLTFCVIAAQFLLGQCAAAESNQRVISWLCARQNPDGGFNGRVGKESDVCYCFWTVSSLALLGQSHLVDENGVVRYLKEAESPIGGFGKTIGQYPDLYHSYLGIAVQKILEDPEPVHVALSISRRALEQFRH